VVKPTQKEHINKKANIKKVAVGLSGGVDSSVAAFLLRDQGYDVTGVYIKCWDIKEDGCAADEDKAYALQTAIKLGIKFESLDFQKEYRKKVINYFYNEYSKGRTPNPDIICNKEIKFGLFFDWAVGKGFDFVATGHYARVNEIEKNNYRLLKGIDSSKDQSYFLYLLGQKQLAKTLFPIGEIKKIEVRKLAKKNKLPAAERPESMGICFIGEVNIRQFLEKRIKHIQGNVLNTSGDIIGKHDGISFFTIGQRHGFKLDNYSASPTYVVDKNAERNELVVGKEKEVYKKSFEVDEIHWVGRHPFGNKKSFSCEIRIRHLGKLFKAKVTQTPKETSVGLKKSAFGVAPGQSCVFYNGDVVLGGGVIQ
jgi:tRNA-specific 2-thiouridylase